MGIKGIYKEIGAGTRIAFCRLAVDSLERRGRPLRLAIDISIWQFQVQAARGGANPAIRTLFYRLVRLLGMPVHPVFVFDGPNKPMFKRNKRSGTGDGMATAMAKRLIRLFGFVVHDAPGEAEAECALLQLKGVVDAVLSEDVDTLMFGCTRTLRNWSAMTTSRGVGGKSSSTLPPTHVSMYEVDNLGESGSTTSSSHSGLDREGMVLVALMSGGDYLPEGVPGCGIKLACEAAKAGFGRSLCRLKRSDGQSAVASWRAGLQHELRTNESHFFRTCHRKLYIPEQFPNLDILRYYTHPVVSPPDVIDRVRASLALLEGGVNEKERVGRGAQHGQKMSKIDTVGLRAFVAETFDWTNRAGAVKFIRVLAPSLLARILLMRWSSDMTAGEEGSDDDIDRWPDVVRGITKQRTHHSTDETAEMRVSFVPVEVVGLDLDAEIDEPMASFGRDGLALNSDDEFEEPPMFDETAGVASSVVPTVALKAAPYDPKQVDVTWVAKSIVERGAPHVLEAWEERDRKKRAREGAKKVKGAGNGGGNDNGDPTTAFLRPGRRRKDAVGHNSGMQCGALDRFVRVTKKPTAVTDDGLESSVKNRANEPGVLAQNPSVDDKIRKPNGSERAGAGDDIVRVQTPPPMQRSRPGCRATDLWSLAGAKTPSRITKPGGLEQRRGFGNCQKTTQDTQPVTRAPLAILDNTAVVVDLLSSPVGTEEPTLPSRDRNESKAGRSPTKKRPQPPQKTAKKASQRMASGASSPRQHSMRRFLTKPIVLSDSDDNSDTNDTILTKGNSRGDSVRDRRPPSPVLPLSPLPSSSPPIPRPLEIAAAVVKKKVYVPRMSAVGYFREEVASAEEPGSKTNKARRGWRQSEIGIVDLTALK